MLTNTGSSSRASEDRAAREMTVAHPRALDGWCRPGSDGEREHALAACWLLEPETEAMLTTLAMALLLGQFPQSCATCGNGHGGSPWVDEGSNGWFPFFTPKGWDRIKNFHTGEILGFGAGKCACPLGSSVPNGDLWALQMRGAVPPGAPTAAPAAAAPTPPAAPNPTPDQGGASNPNTPTPAAPALPPRPTSPFEPLP
jgi:hypothetical protein